jgi:excisionase family DNA binding protein
MSNRQVLQARAQETVMSTQEALAIQPNIYYTVEEAAGLLRVSQSAFLRLLRSGTAHGLKIGRQWRVLGATLLELPGPRQKETETSLVATWLGASASALREVWDNEQDAIYDQLYPR